MFVRAVLNEAISKFQQQIGAYDKERWEEHLEEREQQGIVNHKQAPLRVGRVKTELIDVDLVRGSTFTKAKPEHAWLATTRKGLCRVLLLPIFYRWWGTQLTSWMLHLVLTLYFLQLLCLLIYIFSSPDVKQHLYLIEVLCPIVAMVVIGSTYTSVVSTNVRQKSMKKYSRRDLRRRKREARRKISSEEERCPKRSNLKKQVSRAAPPSERKNSTTPPLLEHHNSQYMTEKPQEIDQNMQNTSYTKAVRDRRSEDGACNTSSSVRGEVQSVGTGVTGGPMYVPDEEGREVSGCSVEDFTLLGRPIEEGEMAGSINVGDEDMCIDVATETGVSESSPLLGAIGGAEGVSGCTEDPKPSEENERYIPPKTKRESGSRKTRKASLLDRSMKYSPLPEEQEETELTGGGGPPQKMVSPTETAGGPNITDFPIAELGGNLMNDKEMQRIGKEKNTLEINLNTPIKPLESDLEEPLWEETAGDETSSSTSSDTSGDDVTSEEEEVAAKAHGTSTSHLEDPFKIFHTTSATSVSNSGKVRVRVFEGNECKKTDMTVLEISCAINSKVHSLEASSEYVVLGLLLSVMLALIPVTYRCYLSLSPQTLTWYSTLWMWRALRTLSSLPIQAQFVLLVVTIERFASSCLIFFMLCAAERTYKQRCSFAKYFAHLTSARQARKSSLPHFRLDKVSNIKAWLSLRSFLKKRGPQRSVNTIVSSAFLLFLLLISVLCMEMLQMSGNFPSSLHNWELVAWTFSLSPFLLKFITLGSEINKKFRNTSMILTEQINLYLNMERKPQKKEDLMLANNVLKLASKLLKELDTPFKISGLVMNPVLYNITRVVVLSAFSGVLTELLGFKLKLWKIKT